MHFELKPLQKAIVTDRSRFKCLSAGRRFGKSYLGLAYLLRGTLQPYARHWFISPYWKQSKMILWTPLKRLLGNHPVKINETTLTITFPNMAEISLKGADRPDSLRGSYLNRVVMDEIGFVKAGVWEEIVFPMLGTTKPKGEALFTGTPAGFNHFKRIFDQGNDDQIKDWKSWAYTTIEGGYVPVDEVEKARELLDPRTYRQEYEASFENYGGVLYYTFDEEVNVKPIEADTNKPLFLSCDFNKEPMAWVVGQQEGNKLNIIDEVLVRYNAKTQIAVDTFIKKFTKQTNRIVYLTGDASNNYESHRDYTTDYIIIKDALQGAGFRPIVQVSKKNPNINNRVNVVCSLLKNERLTIDPKARFLINDFLGVESDNKGGKDKTSDPMLTHSSDALDYLVFRLFGREFFKASVKQL